MNFLIFIELINKFSRNLCLKNPPPCLAFFDCLVLKI